MASGRRRHPLLRQGGKGVALAGKTPAATLAAVMYTHPEQFEKVAPGLFRANPDYVHRWA
jgi:hypothetical protein